MAEPDLGHLLLASQRTLASEVVDALAERGIDDVRPGYVAVFLHIDRRSGTRLTELARRAGITKQGMMLAVDDLESRGYLRRVPDRVDGRAKVVRLTTRGRVCATECRRAVATVEARTRRVVGDRRYDAMREALDRIIESG